MRFHFCFILFCSVWAALTSSPWSPIAAQEITEIEIGFGGQFKPGHWTPVWITVDSAGQESTCQATIITGDADGVPVRYESEILAGTRITPDANMRLLTYAKFGRLESELVVEVIDTASNKKKERTFSTAEVASALPSTRRLIVTVGPSIDVDAVARKAGNRNANTFATARIAAIENLPDHWSGYEGVDTLIITTSDPQLITSLTPEQFRAISRWVHMGGTMLLSVGRQGADIFGETSPWRAFAPGQFLESTRQQRTNGVETYVGAGDRLGAFDITVFETVRGKVEAYSDIGATHDRPVVIRYSVGLGDVILVTADLATAPFSEWKDRPNFLARLLQPTTSIRQSSRHAKESSRVTHLGYNDITGQLRGVLERFDSVETVAFSMIAGLIGLYILLIGPADYFLVKNIFRKMHLSWVTFPIVVCLVGMLAFYLVGNLKEKHLLINQFEIVDFDTSSGTRRGTAWAHIYSPNTETYNISLDISDLDSTVADEILVSWQGLPGNGLGGLSSRTSSSLFSEPYQIQVPSNQSDAARIPIENIPIPVSATKSLVARWHRTVAPQTSAELRRDEHGVLQGTFTNPLNAELRDAVIAYENWSYPISGTLRPGETVRLDRQTPKNFEWRLRRRSMVKSTDFSKPWDQSDFTDVERIAEMMMFYGAAKGKSYTRLSHSFQSYIDLSDAVHTGRAVLYGQSKTHASEFTTQHSQDTARFHQRWSFYRVVFPVDHSAALRDPLETEEE